MSDTRDPADTFTLAEMCGAIELAAREANIRANDLDRPGWIGLDPHEVSRLDRRAACLRAAAELLRSRRET